MPARDNVQDASCVESFTHEKRLSKGTLGSRIQSGQLLVSHTKQLVCPEPSGYLQLALWALTSTHHGVKMSVGSWEMRVGEY